MGLEAHFCCCSNPASMPKMWLPSRRRANFEKIVCSPFDPLSVACRGCSGARIGPKRGTQGEFLGGSWGVLGEPLGHFLGALDPQRLFKPAQDASRAPRRSEEAQRGPKEAPKSSPRGTQEATKTPIRSLQEAQRGPKEAAKSSPGGPQEATKTPIRNLLKDDLRQWLDGYRDFHMWKPDVLF